MTSRRRVLLLLAAAATAQAQSGDREWTRNFHNFAKQLNLFVMDLNEGVYNWKQWKKVESAWGKLEKGVQ